MFRFFSDTAVKFRIIFVCQLFFLLFLPVIQARPILHIFKVMYHLVKILLAILPLRHCRTFDIIMISTWKSSVHIFFHIKVGTLPIWWSWGMILCFITLSINLIFKTYIIDVTLLIKDQCFVSIQTSRIIPVIIMK